MNFESNCYISFIHNVNFHSHLLLAVLGEGSKKLAIKKQQHKTNLFLNENTEPQNKITCSLKALWIVFFTFSVLQIP